MIAATVAALLLLAFAYSVAPVLLLLFIAVLFSLYLGAITDALERHLGAPRPLGVAFAVLFTAFIAAGVGFLIVPPVLRQTLELLSALPAQLELWEAELLEFTERSPVAAEIFGPLREGQSRVGAILQQIGGYFRGIVPYLFSGVNFLTHVVSVVAMGIYLTLRPSLYREGLIALAPPVHRELVRDLLVDLGDTLRSWLVGQILTMIFLAVLTWIGLELLGVPFALAFGAFTGAAAIVPFFGSLVSTLLPAVYVLGESGVVKAAAVVALGIGVQLVEGNVVSPVIMARKVNLPPALTLLSVLVMADLLGVAGLFVAVPALATVMTVVRRIYVHRMLEGQGFRRTLRDRPLEIRLPGNGAVVLHPRALEASIPAMLEE